MNTPRTRIEAGAVVLALAGTLTVICASTLAYLGVAGAFAGLVLIVVGPRGGAHADVLS